MLEKLKPGGVVDNIEGITTSVWFWFVFFWFCLFKFYWWWLLLLLLLLSEQHLVLKKLKPGGVVDNLEGITTSVWFWFVFLWFCLFYILLVVNALMSCLK